MLVVKVTSRDHFSNKSCRDYEELSFSDLDFEFDLQVDLGIDSASKGKIGYKSDQLRQDRSQTRPAKARSVANPTS